MGFYGQLRVLLNGGSCFPHQRQNLYEKFQVEKQALATLAAVRG